MISLLHGYTSRNVSHAFRFNVSVCCYKGVCVCETEMEMNKETEWMTG